MDTPVLSYFPDTGLLCFFFCFLLLFEPAHFSTDTSYCYSLGGRGWWWWWCACVFLFSSHKLWKRSEPLALDILIPKLTILFYQILGFQSKLLTGNLPLHFPYVKSQNGLITFRLQSCLSLLVLVNANTVKLKTSGPSWLLPVPHILLLDCSYSQTSST